MSHFRRVALALTMISGLVTSSSVFAQQVAAGGGHAAALTPAGAVWTWGLNYWGELGNGNTTNQSQPVEVLAISGVVAIAAGGDSTYALESDGTVWAWGRNTSGQLGDGTTTSRSSPVRVGTLTNVAAIAVGTAHGVALKSDGSVWAWGSNANGEVGDGTTTQRNAPVQVTSLGTSAVAIAAADAHSHAVLTDGTVRSWGRNSNREAGDGTTTSPRSTPVQSGAMNTMTRIDAGHTYVLAWDASLEARTKGVASFFQSARATQRAENEQ